MAAIPDLYDAAIQYAAETYLPEIDWLLYKAQLYQESLLDCSAVSHCGAKGLAQFMPATWSEVATKLKFPASATPEDPKYSIPAGAYYMRAMRRQWGAPQIALEDRHRFALASYNAGAGNVLNAWRRAGKGPAWSQTANALVQVTGKHAEETLTYVQRVYRWYDQMKHQA